MQDSLIGGGSPPAPEEQQVFLPPARGEIIKVGILGAVVGLAVPLIAYLLERFFVQPVFCNSGDTLGLCTNSGDAAYYAATVLCGIAAIVLLANWQVFRPLLIIVGVAAIFWGFRHYVQALIGGSVWEYYAISALLYAIAYLLFYWIMRVRNFAVSLGLAIVLVVVTRWFLVS